MNKKTIENLIREIIRVLDRHRNIHPEDFRVQEKLHNLIVEFQVNQYRESLPSFFTVGTVKDIDADLRRKLNS